MAVTFEPEHTRRNTYLFDPADIVIKAELNGRHDLPDITELKASIIEHGQIQPVVVRNENEKPVLIMGFSRWRAIVEINEDRKPADRMKITTVYQRCNEMDGFVMNWEENHKRNSVTPLDEAHYFAQLEKWGLDSKQIAERLHITPRLVTSRLALIEATPEVQKAVKDGRVTPSAAAKIGKMAQDEQRKLVRGEGKVEVPKGEGKPRFTLKDVRLVVFTAANDEAEDEKVRKFAKGLLKKIDGGER